MLLDISGKITPERMKGWSQSKNNTPVADLDLDIQGAASRDDSNLSQFLSFVGIVCLVILVPLTVYLVVNHTRRILARNRRRRRRTSRRRSR